MSSISIQTEAVKFKRYNKYTNLLFYLENIFESIFILLIF